MNELCELAAVVAALLYNLAIMAGCAWLVWHGWSPWWFIGAYAALVSVKTGKAAEIAE